jgi:hypothetical protein
VIKCKGAMRLQKKTRPHDKITEVMAFGPVIYNMMQSPDRKKTKTKHLIDHQHCTKQVW